MSRKEHKCSSFKDHLGLFAYKFICFFLKMIDVRIVAIVGRIIGYITWAMMPQRRKTVARNMRIIIDPMLRPKKLRPLVRRNIVRTVMNLACSLKTGLMKTREVKRSIRIEGADVFEACGSNGHTVISCIPHAGNWEILARIRPFFSRVEHFGSMYRRLTNPLLEDFVYQSRTRYGCEMYSKEDGIREVLKVALHGGLLGVLSDQFTREGVYIPYFGKVTGVTPLPALIYKRCKGKGHLFSVFTRNTALGRWDAVLGREIHLPEGCTNPTDITMQVNLALEKCQRENILDGFWMHHRWKATSTIAPKLDDAARAAIQQYAKLPFRIIVCPPVDAERAEELKPAVKLIANCRPDAEVTIVCPGAQAASWRTADGVARVILTDDKQQSLTEQFDADEVYAKGPFDFLFMFSDEKRTLRKLLKQHGPLYVTGCASSPLAKKFNKRYADIDTKTASAEDYCDVLLNYHSISSARQD